MNTKKTQQLKHIALIMDGNRRWAKEGRTLSSFEGHRKGEERIEPIVDTAMAMGILSRLAGQRLRSLLAAILAPVGKYSK